MTVQEIIDSVKYRVDQSGTGGLTDLQLLDYVDEGYVDFCRHTEMLEKLSDVVISAFDGMVDVPSDFLESRQTRWSYNTQLFPQPERVLDYNESDWMFEVGTPEYYTPFTWNKIRLKPINDAAGTVRFRHAYIPGTMQLTSTPEIPEVWHEALTDFVAAQYYLIFKEYKNYQREWGRYLEKRNKARGQTRTGTPDRMMTQKPIDVYNYPKWDYGYRSK